MRLVFSWYISEKFKDGIFRPDCNVSEPYNLLGSFLNDDGGLGSEYLKKWLLDGITEIDKIKQNYKEQYDMWGQHWGADITKNKVIIYWGYDDNELEITIDFSKFDIAIRKWYEFICTPQKLEYTELIDI